MRRRRHALLFVLSILALVAGRWPGKSQAVEAVTCQPFTATIVDVLFSGPNSEYSQIVQKFYARKADGSSVHVTYLDGPDGQQVRMKELRDADGSSRVVVDGFTEGITAPGAGGYYLGSREMSVECMQRGKPADIKIHGYKTVKMVDELTVPGGGSFRAERYEAPALDCFALRAKAYRTLGEGSGPLTLFQVTEVTTLIEGEPDQSLFVLPEGHVESKPPDVLREYGRRYPDHGQSEEPLQRLDR